MGKAQSTEVEGSSKGKAPGTGAAIAEDLYGESEEEKEFNLFERRKTFRAKKKLKKGSKMETLSTALKNTLRASLGGTGDFKQSVKLPEGELLNEWLAVNVVQFFNAASMVYGTCVEFCTEESCPIMSAGAKYEYLWADGVRVKKPTKVSAPQYMDFMFEWIDQQISDPDIFPVDEDGKFPKAFLSIVKNIFRRLFRLYGHIYYSHFEKIQSIGAEAHLNTCFKHLMYFILEYDLVDKKELAPLQQLIDKLIPPEKL